MQYQAGQVSNQVAYFSLVSFYFFILSLITFCMKSPLSNNSLFRREQLNSLNSAILNTIYHKKYPLNYHLLKSSHAPNRHYQIRKLSTTPSQPITKPPPCKAKLVQTGGNSSRIRKKSSKLRQSMGQHLHAVRLKQVELSFSQNYYFNEINRELNTYLRERRKGRCVLTEKNQKQEDPFYEIQHQKPKQQVSFKQSLNLAKLLKNFRKDHLSQILNETQPNQFDIPSTLNIKHQGPDLKSIDFYQDEQQRWKLARKYPVKAAKMHEDLNKQLIVDMATELKENQHRESEDKYSKMRMMANHKKIISMG